jgi:hypothetical protein
LAEPVTVRAFGPAPAGSASLTVTSPGEAERHPLEISLGAVEVTVELAAHAAALTTLDLPLGSTNAPWPSRWPVTLAALRLTLGRSLGLEIVTRDEDAIVLVARTPLRLEGELVFADDLRRPFHSATEPIRLSLMVTRSGVPNVSLALTCPGPCWTLPGLVELDDGALTATAGASE